jgi:hypothetical protein
MAASLSSRGRASQAIQEGSDDFVRKQITFRVGSDFQSRETCQRGLQSQSAPCE